MQNIIMNIEERRNSIIQQWEAVNGKQLRVADEFEI